MTPLIYLILLIFLLFILFTLNALSQAFKQVKKLKAEKQEESLNSLCYYRLIHAHLFQKEPFDTTYLIILCTKNIVRFLFVFLSVYFIHSIGVSSGDPVVPKIDWATTLYYYFELFLLLLIVGELIPRSIGRKYPKQIQSYFSLLGSFFLILFIPITLPITFSYNLIVSITTKPPITNKQMKVKHELIEMIREVDTGESLTVTDKEIIESVMTFPNRITREVMVPRVDIFALPGKMSIKEAAKSMYEMGYSRVPIYKNTVDEIIGLLMYKDIIYKYMEFVDHPDMKEILDTPVESLVKKTMFTPETKRISQLLQEFRKKQMHMAIVVDEYGGTEGIVTIEDILEEIVGDIADEYDEETELYITLPNGSWIVDAKMSLLDIEEDLGIKIPQDADYDTIGGYIYHRTGTIPSRGSVIDHDDFKINIVNTNERGVEKVRLTQKSHDS